MTNFIEELRWRGMLHDMIPGLEDQLAKEMTVAYIGFDPTAPVSYTHLTLPTTSRV